MIKDGFRLFPEQASTLAPRVDMLYFYLISVSAFFTILISLMIVYFSIKYRKGNRNVDRSGRRTSSLPLEIVWIAVPLLFCMSFFAWGATLYYSEYTPPVGAIEINCVGKQWMWKFQHPNGRREINSLHIPRDMAIKLHAISEDIIHSFYVPAFRVKRDVLPGRYSGCWFQATRTGEFHLFCAEYCGTNHSRMIGAIIVMEQKDYEEWLSGDQANERPAAAGERLFHELRCMTCHRPDGIAGRCPALEGIYGRQVTLVDGSTVTADETYLRESILRPTAKVVAGYTALMPSYDGQVNEEQLMQLIEYLKRLAKP